MFTPIITTDNASRYIACQTRAENALSDMTFTVFSHGDGTATLDSWKTLKDGRRTYNRYEINANTGTCTCPDFAKHGDFCKHTLAVYMMIEAVKAEAYADMEADALYEAWGGDARAWAEDLI